MGRLQDDLVCKHWEWPNRPNRERSARDREPLSWEGFPAPYVYPGRLEPGDVLDRLGAARDCRGLIEDRAESHQKASETLVFSALNERGRDLWATLASDRGTIRTGRNRVCGEYRR